MYYRKRILNKVIPHLDRKTTITLRDCIPEVSLAWSNDATSEKNKNNISPLAGFKNEIIVTNVEVTDLQRERELVHCDGATLHGYLKIDEGIDVY